VFTDEPPLPPPPPPARRDSDSTDSALMTPEAHKATEAVEFIAEHLRNEDEYIQVYLIQSHDNKV
jgi:hypothetical protein